MSYSIAVNELSNGEISTQWSLTLCVVTAFSLLLSEIIKGCVNLQPSKGAYWELSITKSNVALKLIRV